MPKDIGGGVYLDPSLSFNNHIQYVTERVSGRNNILKAIEVSLNNYLKDNSLLISAPKSSVTLFTPNTHQAKTHPRILIEDARLPLVQCPQNLGVHMDTSLSFNKHSSHVVERVSGRNNILKALAGTYWGQQK